MRAETEARPLLLLAVGLVVGLVGFRYPLTLLVPIALVFALPSWTSRAWLLGGLLIGFLRAPSEPDPVASRGFVKGTAVVRSCPQLYDDRTVAQVDVGGRTLLMTAPPNACIAQGDTLRVKGILKPLTESGLRYQAPKGVSGRLQPVEMEVVKPAPFPLGLADRMRRAFLAFTAKTLDRDRSAAVDALCFNVDTGLDRDSSDALRRTGTVHVISASGMHVMILAGALMALLSMLPIRRGVQILLLAALLALYVATTGIHGPTVRAAIVALAAFSAYLFRRESDVLSSLALAAILFLLVQPEEIHNPGFQLSFVTVGAFALWLPRRHHASVSELAKGWIRASLVATIASTPLVAYHFGMLPLVSIPANILIAFVVSPIVVLSLAAFACSFWASLAQGLMLVVSPLVGWLYSTVDFFSNLSFATVPVPEFSGYWLVPIYGAFLLIWRRRETKAT